MSPFGKLPACTWLLQVAGAICLVTLAVQPAQAQAIRDRIIHSQCEARPKAERVSKGAIEGGATPAPGAASPAAQ
ncbi:MULTISPECIES: hypothetical protein [Aphanothece]|uniref:hypothetical protein n=1 Tax=Aphanothece TaxID=1121 RepID=UPI0039847D33